MSSMTSRPRKKSMFEFHGTGENSQDEKGKDKSCRYLQHIRPSTTKPGTACPLTVYKNPPEKPAGGNSVLCIFTPHNLQGETPLDRCLFSLPGPNNNTRPAQVSTTWTAVRYIIPMYVQVCAKD
jgi:hypothetical protein